MRKKYEEENDVFSSQIVFDGSSDAAMAFRYSGVYNPKIGWTVFIDGTATDLVELDIAEKKYKSGDISFGEYVGYSAFKVGKIGWNAFGLTRKDPLTGTGAFVVSELGSKADNWFKKQLGFPDSTNEYLADSLLYFLNDFYGWQCINRKFLENTIEIPNNYISNNNSSNGYVYSRIHRPYTSNYYPEDFTFKVNDTPVYNVNDDTIEGPFSFSFPMNLIRTGKNYLDQLNTHKNKGSYIIETEKKVYIPVPNDKTIPIYIGYNETVEVIESPFEDNIVVSKPDFEVYPEMITVDNSPIFENTANKLSIKLFNAGTRGGFTDVQVLDNNQVIYSGNIYVSKLDSNTIPLNWSPSAGNHQIKVIVNQGLEKYEISDKNNTTTKSFTVYPKTTKGPEMINVFPGKKAEQVKYITFDFKDALYKDYSLIKELALIIDGQPVSPVQYKISNGRGWVSLPQELSNGKHTIELKVVDKFGNQTVEKWETTVEMKQSLIFAGTALTVEEGVTLSLQGRLYLQDENGKQDVSQQATYIVQDSKIAEIINSNRIRGVKQGQTTLIAKYNGLELSIPVTVKQGTSKTYTITIKDMQRMGSSSVDVCGITTNSNYCSNLSYDQKFNHTSNGVTVTITVKQEDLKRFNTVKGVLSIDNNAIIFNLGQEQQLTFSANDFDTKITLPTAAKFNSAQLDILNNGKEEGTIRFYSEAEEIYVPSGMYNLSATVSQNNLLMALTKNNFTVKKGDNKLTIDTGNFVSLKTNSKIKPESISLNNRQTGAYLSAPFIDSILLEKGKYDVNLSLRDSKFSYNVGNSDFNLSSDSILSVDNTFTGELSFEKDEYIGGESVNFYDGRNKLLFKDQYNNTLRSIYNTNNWSNVNAKLIFTNVNNSQDKYEVPLDYFEYANIQLPDITGTFNVKLTIPEFENSNIVAADKKWTVNFSHQVNENSVNANSIYVLDESGNRV